jgi:CheY-like chemotaxis protein
MGHTYAKSIKPVDRERVMSDALWGKLIDAIPGVLWVAFALTAFFAIRGPLLRDVLPHLSEVKASVFGVELSVVTRLLHKAAEANGELDEQASEPAASRVTSIRGRGVLGRLDHAATHLRGGRILWVDDHPSNNRYLIQLLEQFGMIVDEAKSTDEAISLLKRNTYDILLSDVARGSDNQAGLRMPKELRDRGIHIPVVFHAGHFDPSHLADEMVFASTPRVNDVIHYVVDLMERIRLKDR